MASKAELLHIDGIGAQGDGVANSADGPVYVARTLPGEDVLAIVEDGRGRVTELVRSSDNRVEAGCRLFGECGGCAVQHMAPEFYVDWKQEVVAAALRAAGLDCPVDALRQIAARTRRRAVFAARRTKKTVQIGFHAPREHRVIDIEGDDCLLLRPEILRLLPDLKRLVGPLLSRRAQARISVTLAENGLDIAIENIARTPDAVARRKLAADALAMGVLRLSVGGEVIAVQATPFVRFAGVEVTLPAGGAFLQASVAADRIMAELVQQGLGQARYVLDLFSGLGTLSLAIAQRAKVMAIDNDAQAVAALADAARKAQGLKPLATRCRDLFLEAMAGKELAPFDAVVFDPPRAGAKRQAEALAQSDVPLVVAVSCNPATLARDLRILVDGGYQLQRVTPIDQFLFSPHIEVVAVLRRCAGISHRPHR